MTSSRLPGKVMADLSGRPLLAQLIFRLKQCASADEIVLATTINGTDDTLVELARREGVGWFRGSEEDVLARYVGAAGQSQAGVIVRITADCPLIDPQVIDLVVDDLVSHAETCDYASNVTQRTYPRGLDVEAFFWDTLLRIDRFARSQPAREHVTIVVRSERPSQFLCRSVTDQQDNSDLRWTVDTSVDLQLMRTLYEELDLGSRIVPYREMLAYVRARPQLAHLNAGSSTWDPT